MFLSRHWFRAGSLITFGLAVLLLLEYKTRTAHSKTLLAQHELMSCIETANAQIPSCSEQWRPLIEDLDNCYEAVERCERAGVYLVAGEAGADFSRWRLALTWARGAFLVQLILTAGWLLAVYFRRNKRRKPGSDLSK